jgi:hypothetical protein
VEPIEQLRDAPGRGACTDAERRAARALHDRLRGAGERVWVETRWVRPQRRASLVLHALLAVVGGLVSAYSDVVGAAMAGAAGLSLAIEAAGTTAPLARFLTRRATQHVLTEPEGGGVTLIVAAGYDAPRAPSRLVRRLRALVARLPGRPEAWAALCCAAVALPAVARERGVDGTWLGVVQVVAIVLLLAAVGAAVDALSAPWSPGADSAAAVTVALGLLEELRRDPPRALAPALLLIGARTAGPESLRSHLRAERAGPRDTVLLEIVGRADGPPAWAARHSQLRDTAGRAATALGLPATSSSGIRPPEGARRVPAITVAGPADAATLDLALGVVDALDAQLAGAAAPASAAS